MDEGPYLLVIDSLFYPDVSEELVKGALAEIGKSGGTYTRVSVPGAFEIPGAIRMAVRSLELVGGRRRFDGYVALGCVIRGETSHYDHVCQEVTRGLMDIALNFSVAVGNGVLTCENKEQAMYRANPEQGNKGGFAAGAAIRMIDVKRQILPPR
ncbi:MAG: 6,7-dimethyl-8-ribityllumazine synthase [Alphaproteobacteria bacterium]|jgi:6,7-dimethyl-8-ribityllumazine synthase|nr:6,7-dimethyl-8-ribityllumazine synthase [Alphaproteobacteria bacterium]MBT4017851.1 6,7-dimethyl-8-ribityllumazine synthase [Alphaproteobacteria bacterium]MBT5159687.1 6,7-dimethyl-8-ribityllumazine synthase [Alphaproteobacteria bacterium]MBT6384581.1 6,7-dimethyl-8-ribityllumazine synthase [Alphaproteobacteria bacterium]